MTKQKSTKRRSSITVCVCLCSSDFNNRCVDDTSLIAGAIVFIVIQVLLLILWTLLWKKKRSAHAKEVAVIMSPAESTTDSLSYIYDSGIPRRMQ